MDASPIPGFITRRQASERCQRAERTLQRYWSQAIELRDATVLEHLKLRAEDGQTVDGPAVTKELIEKLKHSRQNPTWYVHSDWVEKTYGPRSHDDAPQMPDAETADDLSSGGEAHVEGGESRLLVVLQDELAKRDEQISYLREELTIKNDQIKEANERTRQSNVLMHDLQKMLADWQQQAFRTLPAASPLAAEGSTRTAPHEKPHEAGAAVASKRQEGSRRKRATKPSSPSTTIDKAQTAPAKPAEKRQPTALEKHTPTLHKAITRLFRR